MEWIVFSYSLPSKGSSSPRVTLWRRLRRLGAVAPASSVHILPAREECLEAFQWLAQEIRHAHGEAMVMHVTHFDGLSDQELIARFQAGRREEYAALDTEAAALEEMLRPEAGTVEHDRSRDALERLRRRYDDVARVDYFACPEAARVAARLDAIARLLSPEIAGGAVIAPAPPAEFRDARWITRPRPHVDRLASIWLIRRFVNADAAIRYGAEPEPDEVAFDMAGARFGHQGNLCTFETMLRSFGLDNPALRAIAEIVHEIDLRDGHSLRPEIPGIDAVLQGWLHADLTDLERETAGIALFDGLYAAFGARTSVPAGVTVEAAA